MVAAGKRHLFGHPAPGRWLAAWALIALGSCRADLQTIRKPGDLALVDRGVDLAPNDGGSDNARQDAFLAGVLPSNVGDRVDQQAATAQLVAGEDAFRYWHFDTESGRILAYDNPVPQQATSQTIRPAGAGLQNGVTFTLLPQVGTTKALGVFGFRELTVRAGAELVGRGAATWVLLSSTSITVAGLVSASADAIPGQAAEPGPGGERGSTQAAGAGVGGGEVGSTLADNRGGGGGASYGGLGGDGSGHDSTGGLAGSTYGDAHLVPLIGGSAGGAGGGGGVVHGRGGHGGGALQLSAARSVTLAAGGRIEACGGGGGGRGVVTDPPGAGGGGSGGAILIEAPQVSIDGLVGANGGTGGSLADGIAGNSINVPVENPPAGSGSDRAGVGGDAVTLPPSTVVGQGGGGGGGYVRINTATGAERYGSGVTPNRESGLFTIGVIARP